MNTLLWIHRFCFEDIYLFGLCKFILLTVNQKAKIDEKQ